ncbi:metallophosphoesterase [Companilactobacillus metriopterae]|uniref:metallophosphoesterase n=1 Tax=Companilactobacillus metriopterae TaxID=1909267 RepID=UPI00100A3FC3|nr:metallophosphoesterase [Companilactobacillus metriopterae]
MNYFISDTHFYHDSLLGQNDFAPRLFDSVEEMNEKLIKSWNERVTDHDTVYHLGDVAMRPKHYPTEKETFDMLERLNGHIILIKGNHDYRSLLKYLMKNNRVLEDGGLKYQTEDVGSLLKFDHHQFYCTHYPMLLGQVDQILNLHGHIHHYSVGIAENINVGVDSPELQYLENPVEFGTPLRGEEILVIYDKKKQDLMKRS